MSNNHEVTLEFLGAAQTVTGSRFLLSVEQKHYLFDCGLFQGPREIRDLNWEPFPVSPKSLEAIVLTHAHLDHSGYIPIFLRKNGQLPVFASEATCALLEILLPDSGYLQEEQARYANKKRYSNHYPASPLYTEQEAEKSLKSLVPVGMDSVYSIDSRVQIRLRPAGHILGSATVECMVKRAQSPMRIVFTGDLGRFDQEFMKPPAPVSQADYLVIESTYGNRDHSKDSLEDSLESVVKDAVKRRGVIVIPSFAVGRVQQVLFYLRKLEDANRIPSLPVYIDSPMAVDSTDVYCRFGDEHNLSVELLMDKGICPLRCKDTRFVRTVEESKALNERQGPFIVISASGMCEGGRVMHHLKNRLPDPRNTMLLVGFQALGTRGRLLQDGATSVSIHGDTVQVRAQVVSLDGLSAHGDRSDLLRWLGGFQRPPKKTFIVHGEPAASEALRDQIQQQLGWEAEIPGHRSTAVLS